MQKIPNIHDEELVSTLDVSCDGNTMSSKHPKVYLKIPVNEKFVVCPYCNKRFMYNDNSSLER